MPLELHTGARTRLVELLSRGLEETLVQGSSFLDYRSLTTLLEADAVLPGAHSTLGRQVAAFISDEPVSDFVAGEIGDELRTREFTGGTDSELLTSIPEYADTRAVAERLTESFTTLPWAYEVFTPVPWELGQLLGAAFEVDEHSFGDRVSLVRGAALSDSHPTGADSRGLLGEVIPTGVNAKLLYLRIRTSGYIPRYGGTTPIEDAHLTVRAFFGLCVALRLARTGAFFSSGPQKRTLLIYRGTESGWAYHSLQDVPTEAAQAIAGMGVGKLLGEFDSDAQVHLTRGRLTLLQSVFQRTDESDAVLSAAQWLFDSYATPSRLLSFVQATVALETLLGEKAASDQVGLGELLANRAAYLIAKDRAQRNEVLSDFRRIYDTRSKIVHRGKNRLSASERGDLQTLEWICSRVIQEEVRLLSTPSG